MITSAATLGIPGARTPSGETAIHLMPPVRMSPPIQPGKALMRPFSHSVSTPPQRMTPLLGSTVSPRQ